MGINAQNNDESVIIHLDNTAIHRLQFLLSKNLNSTPYSNIEFINILHLLESLLLADKITISTFESDSSQLISNNLLEVIDALSDSLSLKKIESDLNNQLKIAEETVMQIFEQKLLSFNPELDSLLFAQVNVSAGRPSEVLEINSDFWKEIYAGKHKYEYILDKAKSKVLDFKTDALFIYGIAKHREFSEKILLSYATFGTWTDEHWNRLHVMFRSFFNQNLSHDLGAIYSPPPVRSIALESAHNKIKSDVISTIENLPVSFLSKENKTELESILNGVQFPIPLIGIAAIPQTNKKDKDQFIEHFLKIREETSELRNLVRKINRFESEYSVEQELSLLQESLEIKKEIAYTLKLNNPTILPKKVSDIGIYNNLEELLRFFKKENKTARVFSNILQRINEAPHLYEVKKYLDS